MKFEKIVNQLSDRVTEAICRAHGRSDAALSFLLDADVARARWRTMSEDERQVICFFLRRKGTDMLTYREIEQESLPMSAIRFRVALTKLRRLGFVFTLRRMWGEQAYVISEEQLELFRRCCSPTRSESWESGKKLPGHSSYHIVDDLLQVLNVVSKTSIGFSKKGTLHKRNCNTLFQSIKLSADAIAPFAESLQPQYPFDIREAFLLSALIDNQLLTRDSSQLTLGEVESWVAQDAEQLAMDLLDAFIKRARFDPKLEMLYRLLQSLDRVATYQLEPILRSLGDLAPPLEAAVEKCIEPLTKMGFMTSTTERGATIFTWNSYPSSDTLPIYIQPNFEIILPAFSPFHIKWKFMNIAELTAREEMWTFKLNERSCRHAFENGKTAEEIIDELRATSAVPVPENVILAIEQWERAFVQVAFWDVRILRVNQADLAKTLTDIPAISSLLLERLGARAFVIRARDSDRLTEELEKRGYAPGPVVNFLNDGDSQPVSLQLPLFRNEPSDDEFQVESVFPDLEDALPGLRQVPRMWLSHYHRYHGSTLRELIQRAIEIGLELKMEWSGASLRARPVRLINREGFWTLIADDVNERRVECPLDEIEKIKMVSPL